MSEELQLTPADAAAKLDALKANPEWTAAFLKGDGPAVAEYGKLLSASQPHAESHAADMAIAGKLFDGGLQPSGHLVAVGTATMLREIGIPTDVIKQVLIGQPVSQAEHDAASKQKEALMRDQEWSKQYLAGNGPHREQMTLLHVILSSPIKQEKTA